MIFWWLSTLSCTRCPVQLSWRPFSDDSPLTRRSSHAGDARLILHPSLPSPTLSKTDPSTHRPRPKRSCHFPFGFGAAAALPAPAASVPPTPTPAPSASGTSSTVSCTVAIAARPTAAGIVITLPSSPFAGTGGSGCVCGVSRISALDVFFCRSE